MRFFFRTTTFTLAMLLTFGATSFAFAESGSADAVKEAALEVKDSVSTLVGAKDDESDDLALRIATFKKVVVLSLSEATNLKIQLVFAEPEDESLLTWHVSVLRRLGAALDYFDTQDEINFREVRDVDMIKEIATDFKDWREVNYVSLVDEVNSFLLLERGSAALAIARVRVGKIGSDLIKLHDAEIAGIAPLTDMLFEATSSIAKGVAIMQDAEVLFAVRYVDSLLAALAVENTTTTDITTTTDDAIPVSDTDSSISSDDDFPISPSTTSSPAGVDETTSTASETEDIPLATDSAVSSSPALVTENAETDTVPPSVSLDENDATASSSAVGATTTEAVLLPETQEEIPDISIKDLVRASFASVRDAYQIFIEMSGFVRKLF